MVRWVARARDGERRAQWQGRPRGSQLDAREAFLTAMIEAEKDITLDETVERPTGLAPCPLDAERLAASPGLGLKRSRAHWSKGSRISARACHE